MSLGMLSTDLKLITAIVIIAFLATGNYKYFTKNKCKASTKNKSEKRCCRCYKLKIFQRAFPNPYGEPNTIFENLSIDIEDGEFVSIIVVMELVNLLY